MVQLRCCGALASFGILTCVLAGSAVALPTSAPYVDDGRCDPIPNTTLTHELGEAPTFPVDELIFNIVGAQTEGCGGTGSVGDDWVIFMTNASTSDWSDVYFVVDGGGSVGNADGTILGADAFRIDATGVNVSLVGGDDGDGIFEMSETWQVLVTDFFGAVGPGMPAGFLNPMDSVGVGPASTGVGLSNASIVANAIPEPGTLLLLGGGLLALAARRAGRR